MYIAIYQQYTYIQTPKNQTITKRLKIAKTPKSAIAYRIEMSRIRST